MNDDQLAERVRRLRRLRQVPDDVLMDLVWEQGCCVSRFLIGDVPAFCAIADNPDRALAEYLCASCTVVDHCLELELRTAGERTVGVFGGTTEDERRELYRLWLADRAAPEGGQQP